MKENKMDTIADRNEMMDNEKKAKSLFEEFEVVAKNNKRAIEKKEQAVHEAMEELIALSEKTGVPVEIDPFGDFAIRSYLPEKFVKLRDELEKLNSEENTSEQLLEHFAENYYCDEYDDGTAAGWNNWSASNLHC